MKLTINGREFDHSGDPDMPLLWYLREEAGFKGVKFGCGIAQCGACTVHLDGRAVRSCSLPVAAAEGAVITTIEGLADGEDLHPVQEAWIEELQNRPQPAPERMEVAVIPDHVGESMAELAARAEALAEAAEEKLRAAG